MAKKCLAMSGNFLAMSGKFLAVAKKFLAMRGAGDFMAAAGPADWGLATED